VSFTDGGSCARVSESGLWCITLRSAAPLPRRVSQMGTTADVDVPQDQQLPSYRIVVEA
jgi:hypothetical protein